MVQTADLGTGLSIEIDQAPLGVPAGTPAVPTWAGMLRDVSASSIERDSIDASHNNSVKYREFLGSDLSDPGEVSTDILFDPDDVSPDATPAGTDPMDEQAIQLIVKFPALTVSPTTPRMVSQLAFVLSWEWAAPFEDLITGVVNFKLNGAPTWAAEVPTP
jgi:hypothetical protein